MKLFEPSEVGFFDETELLTLLLVCSSDLEVRGAPTLFWLGETTFLLLGAGNVASFRVRDLMFKKRFEKWY